MKAVVELTPEETKKYNELTEDIDILQLKKWIHVESRNGGYAHYTFKGFFDQALVDFLHRKPTPEEIIIVVDGGFSHFGATCSIWENNFSGRVNTD